MNSSHPANPANPPAPPAVDISSEAVAEEAALDPDGVRAAIAKLAEGA